MFKNIKLSTRIIGLVVFLLLMLSFISFFALRQIHHLELEIEEIANDNIPLMRVVSNLTKYQLEQATRFGTIVQYGYLGEKEKFNEEIRDFMDAGRRVNDVVREGRKIAREGIKHASREVQRKEFKFIENMLGEVERTHADYEHHSEEMFQEIAMFMTRTPMEHAHREEMGAATQGIAPLTATPRSPGIPAEETAAEGGCAAQGLSLVQIQILLRDLNLYQQTIDGGWGPGTEQAVREYQGRHPDLPVTGELNPATCQALGAEVRPEPEQTSTLPRRAEGDPDVGNEEAGQASRREFLLAAVERMEKETTLLEEEFSEVLEHVDNITQALTQEARAAQRLAYAILIPLIIFSLGGGLLLSILIVRNIVSTLRNIIDSISNGSAEISAASHQIASTSQDLAEKAASQAAALEQASASLAQITELARNNSKVVEQSHSLIEESHGIIHKTQGKLDRAEHLTETINNEMTEHLQQNLQSLNERLLQINLLATNASVEATRHEATQGFGILTQEIKQFAGQSLEFIHALQKQANHVLEELEQNHQLHVETLKDFTYTTEVSDRLKQRLDELNEQAAEYAGNIAELDSVMTSLSNDVQANAASSEESAAASEQLSAQASSMLEIVNEIAKLMGGSHRKLLSEY